MSANFVQGTPILLTERAQEDGSATNKLELLSQVGDNNDPTQAFVLNIEQMFDFAYNLSAWTLWLFQFLTPSKIY